MTYKCINGWTKAKMKKQIKKFNNGKASYDVSREVCLYLNPVDKNRCAIGCFIPYKSGKALKFELDAKSLLEFFPKVGKFMPLHVNALNEFQHVHDENKETKNMHQILFDWIDKNVRD